MATVTTLLHQVTSWLTRHYAVKAAWARDIIHSVGIDVKHTPGEYLVADILTKTLKGERLRTLSSELGLIPIKQPRRTPVQQNLEAELPAEVQAQDPEERRGCDRSKEECKM